MRRFLQLCLTAVFAFALQAAHAQTRTVTGRITSADDGSGLPGVNVVVKGTGNGTVTDVNGNYTVNVPQGATTLVFSFIGLQSQEVDVTSRASADVRMEQDAKQLEEVVVNAIGVETPKDKLGTAPATVRGDALAKSGETSVINGLAGKAPGLNITRNGGDPGAGSYIQIRGQSTITGDLQPLIVIDGMPMYNSYQDGQDKNQIDGVQQQSRLNDLNPDDIASVEVLKSASAAALWGSRAANGVIMITTKKGKAGKLRVGYAGTVSFDRVNKTPKLQRTFGQGTGGLYRFNSSTSWGDKISDRPGTDNVYVSTDDDAYTGYITYPNGVQVGNIVNGTEADPGGGKNTTQTYDHGKDVFRTGTYWEHALNLSGGNERSNFYVSYSNLDQKGIIQTNSDYKRNTARINASTMLTDKFQASTSVTYSNIRSNRAQQGSNVGGIYLSGLRTPADYDNANYIGTYTNPNGVSFENRQTSYRNGNGASENSIYDNPFWTIRNNRSFTVVNRIIGNVELNYDLTDWLSLRGNAGVDTYSDRRTDFISAHSSIQPGKGRYTEHTISESQWNTNLFATARHKFSDVFSGGMILGFNYNSRQFNDVGSQVIGFIIPDAPPNLDNSDPTNRSPFNYASTIKTSAGFTEITGELYDQVFVTLTGRAESASTFGPQAKSLFFYPSASAAWQFTKFTGANGILNFGKLRAAYGIVGRQPDPYTNLTKYGPATMEESWGGTLYGPGYGGGYGRSTTSGNPGIKPERKHELEVGTDLRFLNDRISFSATAFYSKTTDVILPVSLAPSSGFQSIYKNAAELENKGLEFTLEPTWVKTSSGFTWSTSFLWSLYRNKVLSLNGVQSVVLSGGGFSDGSSRAVEGHPIGVIWGTYYAKNADGSYVTDENGYPTLNPSEGVIGNPNPDWRASIGNTFSYKGFTLYALFDFQIGGDMWNGTRGALVNYGTAAETGVETTVSATEAANIKTFDGETIATSTRAHVNPDGSYTFRGSVTNFGAGQVALDQAWYTNRGSGFTVNAPFIEDATWARLREVTLSYSLGSAAFKQATKLSSVTFSVTGRNIALWTDYKGIDPETNLTGANNGRGIDYFQNPNTRSLIFKLAITY